jgi:hypothetical protein
MFKIYFKIDKPFFYNYFSSIFTQSEKTYNTPIN